MRILLSVLVLLLLLGGTVIFVHYFRHRLLEWFGITAPRRAGSGPAEAEAQDPAIDEEEGTQAGFGKSRPQSRSLDSLGKPSQGSRASPMVIVAADDACRGELLSYHSVVKACNNWAEDRILGRGGMATVYRGSLPRFGEVAVKRFHQEQDGSGRDFLRELEALCKCRHPHILEIIGRSEDGLDRMIIMPLMEGGTFNSALPRMPWSMRASALGHVIRAVAFLHGKGIVHRDIKTSNILLDRSLRHARLADFGLAKDVLHTNHQGTTGIVVGSPGYMAPELMMRPANEKTDAFASGVVFLEILTALPAWDADHSGGMSLSDRVVVDGAFQERSVDAAARWPAKEVLVVGRQATGLTLFDPGRRLTVLQVEQDAEYVEHLKRADHSVARPSAKTIGNHGSL